MKLSGENSRPSKLYDHLSKIAVFIYLAVLSFNISGADLVITTNTREIVLGFTKELTVKCSFRQGSVRAVSNLISLVLTHQRTNGHGYQHKVSVSSSGGILNSNFLQGTSSGIINNRGISYVKVIWKNPRDNRAGVYKCDAHGIDTLGRPVALSANTSVDASTPYIDMVALEIRLIKDVLEDLQLKINDSESIFNGQIKSILSNLSQLQTQTSNATNQLQFDLNSLKNSVSLLQTKVFASINQLQSNTSNSSNQTRTEINSLNSSVAQLLSRISSIQRQQDKDKSNLENARSALFYSSSNFNGKRYWLTRSASFFNPSYGQSTCATFGGYLTELDSQSELNFVQNFVNANGSAYFAVMMGATDEGHEGRWINRYSQTPVAHLWYPRQPDNTAGAENCSCLWKVFGFAMNDCPCYYTSNAVGFLCEIPE
ncbi:C-type lectin domain family 4 member K [Biomphalaria pfeifferi]|uniref:C-type lectin domain family 4 member K n=1 Tax=Biomphalaria pfeifferi TaxID=112525 RepID=A0AAD8BVS8_BIOPF|nr:C-type lectin domain family 4 member K [Biomphalaria pfeifferi]